MTLERIAEIKAAVQNLSNSREIGANYTQAYIIDAINANLNFPEITGVQVSTDGTTWSDTTAFNEGNIGLLAAARISVEWPTGE
jgi:hypothetical protein